jgi:hypothetical protein
MASFDAAIRQPLHHRCGRRRRCSAALAAARTALTLPRSRAPTLCVRPPTQAEFQGLKLLFALMDVDGRGYITAQALSAYAGELDDYAQVRRPL